MASNDVAAQPTDIITLDTTISQELMDLFDIHVQFRQHLFVDFTARNTRRRALFSLTHERYSNFQ